MLTTFSCPICNACDWEAFGQCSYKAKEHHPGGPWYKHPYVELRRRVLFEIWFPGADQVQLSMHFCRACGFVCYSPRPEAKDLGAKYAFLAETEVHIGGQRKVSTKGLAMDERRACKIYRLLDSVAPVRGKSILDVGGGDGKLMTPFLDADCACHLVDYNKHHKPGIHRLGNTVQDIPASLCFDFLTCSHVLEHVAEPVPFLREFLPLLKADGKLYVEVPLEIWEVIPIISEPVTHVNFFTPATLARAVEEAGFRVLMSRAGLGTYGDARIQIAWAIAEPGNGTAEQARDIRETTRRVYPRPIDVLKRALWVEPHLEGSLMPWTRLPLRIAREFGRKLGVIR